MTIHTEAIRDGIYNVECDRCGYDEEFYDTDWDDLLAEIKAVGWRNVKIKSEWENHCPSCSDARNDFK